MKKACYTPTTPLQTKAHHHHNTLSNLNDQSLGNGWLEGLFGLEKENIRVDPAGNLSQKPHPALFGNKLKHPFITTDFSESQLEMRTPPLPDIEQALGFLETTHDIVSLNLDNEYLWPQSIPPVLPDDAHIPIARYDEDGREDQAYRELLAKKYGPKNQLFSGIHFNLSLGNNLLESLYSQQQSTLSFDDFKDAVYLKATRQLLRLRWLYIYLFGNSPVVDNTMILSCKHTPEKVEKHVVGLSIRNSCYGYQNLDELYPDYSSAQALTQSIDQLVKEGKLSAPKELYAPVRPKFIADPTHITYLELRFIDIDPMTKAGITQEALYFLHALVIYGLLSEEPDAFDQAAQSLANKYNNFVALHGLNPLSPVSDPSGKQSPLHDELKERLAAMTNLFHRLGITHKGYLNALESVQPCVVNHRNRKVFDTLDGIVKKGYIPFHLEKAQAYLQQSREKEYAFFGLEDMELSTQLLLREAVKRGVSFNLLDRKDQFIRLYKDGNTQYVKQATKTSLDNYVSILAMENKQVTKQLLQTASISTPAGHAYSDRESAYADFVRHSGKPIVVKPNQTNYGIGITILKDNRDQSVYQRAVDIAFEHDTTILIETFFEGKEYRMFVIGGEVAGILHRVPANVTGDGVHSIRALVDLKNQDPLRGKGYRTPLERIRLEEAETMFLTAQNKTAEDVPAIGETVFIRENSNISTGGDSIDVTDDVHDSYKQLALKAAKALDVKITGLDMMIKDTSLEAQPDNYTIIEMNFNPAIHIHCHPYKGINRKLNEKLMDALGY